MPRYQVLVTVDARDRIGSAIETEIDALLDSLIGVLSIEHFEVEPVDALSLGDVFEGDTHIGDYRERVIRSHES